MKIFKLFWQVLIFPVLYVPYMILNQNFIVKWFKCGCPYTNDNGNVITDYFNANDFTMIFWGFISFLVIGISIFNMKNIKKWYFKLIYILLISVFSLLMAYIFINSMRWK